MAAGMMCLLLWLGFHRFDLKDDSITRSVVPTSGDSSTYRKKKLRWINQF